jgi:hypothetical protein
MPGNRSIHDREEDHQAALFAWARLARRATHPELRMLYHPANGGHRPGRTASKLAGQGVRPGVADVILDVARGGFHGLRIELKRMGKHEVSAEQTQWIEDWNREGYHAVVCVGWEAARNVILGYLEGAKG